MQVWTSFALSFSVDIGACIVIQVVKRSKQTLIVHVSVIRTLSITSF